MKKVLTLVLALVFVLALAAPAMAFTGDTTPLNPTPYTLKIYLVEHQSEDIFTGWIGLPAVDRGYAKNETVAAVVELKVPKGEATLGANWAPLEISAKNATFRILKNGPDVNAASPKAVLNTSDNAAPFKTFTVDKDTKLTNDAPNAYTKDNTYKWLVFAYVTGDDASLTAKLVENAEPVVVKDTTYIPGGNATTMPANAFKLHGKAYHVNYVTADKKYIITVCDNDNYNEAVANLRQIELFVDGDHKTTGMTITPVLPHNPYPFFIDQVTGLMSIIEGGNIKTSGATFDAVKKVYDDVAVKVFGMNVALRGNFLRDKYFKDLVSNKTLVAKVDIKPWTAYVKVPDNVVVNPPKTGAAASILGFVMVALAGASAVALKKR